MCIIQSLVWRPLSLTSIYICLGACWRTPLVAGVSRGYFKLHWRHIIIGDLLLLSVLWSGCCLFDTLSISILHFIYSQILLITLFSSFSFSPSCSSEEYVAVVLKYFGIKYGFIYFWCFMSEGKTWLII